MSFVLAVSTGVAGGFGAFVLVMSLIGFLLIRADKMRWLKHKERTDVLMRIPPKEGEKISKKRKKTRIAVTDGDYAYQGRINDKILLLIAFLFGGIGELLAMAIYRHKWYKWSFRTGMPLIAVLNLALAGLIIALIAAPGGRIDLIGVPR